MSDSKKVQEQELKKLEDEAYFELRQIIAEAMQYQDVELLDARIAAWKNKYKKLLDRPSTSSKSDFKKRIEFLLNEYYSSITQYILEKLKSREEKKVKNQAKALRQLYRIIKDTNDLDLLKNKVKKWEEKYPISSFLNMYQKRIKSYTREKTLKENAFEQEKAFHDLVDITKKNETIDELKERIEYWEDTYGINDKYSIDDFLKHQSEIKRFTSNEFLISIAKDDNELDSSVKTESDIIEEYNNRSFSDLHAQASSYASLKAISQSNVDEMFKWVYNNRHIKFNDEYKVKLLTATRLRYSPTYLKELSVPSIDISQNSLSYNQYKKIEEIKEYAIISYFNLLLPPEKAISNNYFTKYAQTIYNKYSSAKIVSKAKDPSSHSDNDMLSSGVEVSLKSSNKTIYENNNIDEGNISKDIYNMPVIPKVEEQKSEKQTIDNFSEIGQLLNTNTENDKHTTNKLQFDMESATDSIKSESRQDSHVNSTSSKATSPESTTLHLQSDTHGKNFDQVTAVVLFSPFLEALYKLNQQATTIDYIDSDTTRYIEEQKTQDLEFSITSKTKTDLY